MRKGALTTTTAVLTAALVLGVGCGGEEESVVREQDGQELAALLGAAREAIAGNNGGDFRALYAANGSDAAANNWNEINTARWNWGDYLVSKLTEVPGIERKETGLRVQRLDLDVWYDFSLDSDDREDVYRTTWSLVREDSLWRINYVKLEKTTHGYGQWMYGLHHLAYSDFLRLEMDWEEGYDQTPLLARAWEAVGTENAESLKPFYVDGSLFYALEAGVDMPEIANGEYGAGENNRANSLARLVEQVKRMRETTRILGVEPEALAPFFCAYRVLSMPDECTRLSLTTEYDGSYAPSADIARFSLIWTGAYLKSRWLLDTMHAERIHFE